ncbi:MAG: RluA family pseudouridine synthase [Chlamydiales bacterium]|nr:RluA family pseudouridine synthase [Chlamydiales bacterium]
MTLHVSAEETKLRLDKLLALRYPEYSRQYFQYLIREKLVLVNGNLAKKAAKLEEGDEIEIEFALTPEISLEPEEIPLEILFEDDDLIAVNKPAGMVVHPAAGNWSGTFVNALLFHCKQLPKGGTLRPGIVHRLDKETSGVLVAAKNERAQQLMVELFANRQIEKEYLAVCVGNPGNRLIAGKIGRHPVRRKEMAILEEKGREARTRCESLAHSPHLSLVRLFPETGRTHQLRVHLKAVGTPILGDSLYGIPSMNRKFNAKRQMLHAFALRFKHPLKKEEIELKAPIPQDMKEIILLVDRTCAF